MKKQPEIKTKHSLPKINVITSIFLAMMFMALAYTYSRAKYLEKQNQEAITTPTPTAQILPSPTPIPTPTPKPTPIKTTNPNPIIDCNVSVECGGGTKQMTSSACKQSTCCQIGNVWSLYKDLDTCKADQAKHYSNNSDSNTITTNPPCEVYYASLGYSQTYTHLTADECNSRKAMFGGTNNTNTPVVVPTPTPDNSVAIQDCLNRANQTYNNATLDCKNLARANGGTSSSWYLQCTQGATQDYSYAKSLCK